VQKLRLTLSGLARTWRGSRRKMRSTRGVSGMQETRVVNGDPQHGHRRTGRRWWGFLAHRWPTALGIAVAAITAFDLRVDAGFVSSLSALIVVMALVYVGAAALGRRSASWVVLLAGLPVAFVVPSTLGINPSVILLLAAAFFLVVGAVRGRSRESADIALQAAGVLGFGAMSLAALSVTPELGVYLVAFALLGHAAWDAFHYVRDRVVARSYAEFCGFLDLLLGVAILVLA
jgi:hypothetical protein